MSAIASLQFRPVLPLHPALDIPISQKPQCDGCRLLRLCLPTGLSSAENSQFGSIVNHRRISKDEPLYKMNDPFRSIYAIRLGHFKTHQVTRHGSEQIAAFHMSGELLGLDGMGTDRHQCYATALEDSEVCEIPYLKLEPLFTTMPPLLRQFHRLMSEELTREQTAMLLLGNLRAEQRFAAFLVNLSARYGARGYSANSFHLRMSREDIANYLGLTIESVSRIIARFKGRGLVNIMHRDVELLDLPTLRALSLGDPVSVH
jgi:CRP/FNR family transcriptional regulator